MADSADPAEAGWAAYYRAHEGRPVSPLLRRAIAYFSQGQISRQAVDLGCGAGNEARFLLESGWDLSAIDCEPLAVQRVQDLVSEAHWGRLEAVVAAFEDLRHLPHFDLIHAGLSLPFCRPQNFASLWALIGCALKPGGVFVGHFFGDRDDWSHNPEMTFHTAGQVTGLLAELDVKLLYEHEADGTSLQGPKHWHRFGIVAMMPTMRGSN